MRAGRVKRRGRRSAYVALALATLVVAAVLAPASVSAEGEKPPYEGSDFYPPPRTNRGAVASVNGTASQIGIDILDSGGNAMDAAVAVAFALGVLRPEFTGPGGGGFLVYRSADGSEVNTLDFREAAPADIGTWNRTEPGVDDFAYAFYAGAGHRVVGVPGNIAGLTAALERYGTKSLTDVIDPAADLGEKGVRMPGGTALFLFLGIPFMRLYPETAKVFLHDSAIAYPTPDPVFDPLVDNTGEFFIFKQPEHAASLRKIAAGGPDVFYKGEIGDMLVADFAKSGTCDPNEAWTCYLGDKARITHADLANYRAVWRDPIHTNYRGHQIFGAPPPASGGIFLAETLNILDGIDLTAEGFGSADHLHYVTEATKIALADRKEYLGDPDFVEMPVHTLTSKKYAERRRAEIKGDATQIYAPADEGKQPSHTTHLSVIDEDGNAVSMTLSLNSAFGSGVVAPGTGFVLNNHLLDFDTVNVAGQQSNGQTGLNNRPAAGKRPLSAMSPSIVVREGKALLTIGGAGGPTILRGVTQAVIDTIDFGMDVGHAIDAPRIFPANEKAPEAAVPGMAQDVLDMEGERIHVDTRNELKRRGHRLSGEDDEYSDLPTLSGVSTDLTTGEHLAYTRAEEGPAVQSSTP